MQFIGLDLAWSPRNRSGGAVLSAEGHVVCACTLGGDEEILAFVEAGLPDGCPGVVAIDAPLAVPNAQGRRVCDQELTTVFARFEAGPYPANRSNLGRYGGLRAEGLRLHLQERGFRHDPQIDARRPTRRVVEVFPHPAIVSLFGLERTLKYKPRVGRDYGTRWSELAYLRDGLVGLADASPPLHLPPEVAEMPIEGRRGGDLKGAEDVLDAVVCAYSALYAWHHGPRGAAVYGLPAGDAAEEGEPGHILVPMTATMWERIQSRTGRLLFLAGDGLLKRGADDRMPDRPQAVDLLPGVGTLLRHYAALGWRLIALPDPGGAVPVSRAEGQTLDWHQAMLDALPVEVDASYLCPHDPQGTASRDAPPAMVPAARLGDHPNRKPAPGNLCLGREEAILDALARFAARPGECLVAGDRDDDRRAAEAAGVPFRRASELFRR